MDNSTATVYIADTSNNKAAAVTGLAQSGDAARPDRLLSASRRRYRRHTTTTTKRKRFFVTDERKDSFASKPWQAKISRRPVPRHRCRPGRRRGAGRLPARERAAGRLGVGRPGPPRFDLSQIKHLVFLMQENRSFDHYFGTFPKVAGFSDPRAVRLPRRAVGVPAARPVQPRRLPGTMAHEHRHHRGGRGPVAQPQLGARSTTRGTTGAMDGWLRAHIASDGPAHGPYTMGYYTQEDIPFHWALAQAFTLCDNYHCSVLGPTDPNRAFWQNGTNDPQGLGGGPILETVTPPSLTFESGAETLFKAGYTVKCYLGGGAPDTYPWFANFKSTSILPPELLNPILTKAPCSATAPPVGSATRPTRLRSRSRTWPSRRTAPTACCPTCHVLGTLASEHPPAIPAAGANFLAQILDALAANDDLWNTTLFVLDYDENDGFFDHVPPPTPDKAEFPEEFVTMASAAGTPGGDRPVGAGFRVPCFIISPWSTGGKIFSQVSDHTSCLRLIEAVAAAGGLSGRGPIRFPNISRWRRQTFGDLTGALVPGAPFPPRRAPSSIRRPGLPNWRPSRPRPCCRCLRSPGRLRPCRSR